MHVCVCVYKYDQARSCLPTNPNRRRGGAQYKRESHKYDSSYYHRVVVFVDCALCIARVGGGGSEAWRDEFAMEPEAVLICEGKGIHRKRFTRAN